MAWVRIDTGFVHHPKLLRLTPAQRWVHLAAMCWTAGHGTGGVIPAYALSAIGATAKNARTMVEVGLWDEHPQGWRVHDWHVYNIDADSSKEARDGNLVRRAQWREEKRRQRRRKDGHVQPDTPDMSGGQSGGQSGGMSGGQSASVLLPARVSRPDPTRPDPTPVPPGRVGVGEEGARPSDPEPSPGAQSRTAVGGGATSTSTPPGPDSPPMTDEQRAEADALVAAALHRVRDPYADDLERRARVEAIKREAEARRNGA